MVRPSPLTEGAVPSLLPADVVQLRTDRRSAQPPVRHPRGSFAISRGGEKMGRDPLVTDRCPVCRGPMPAPGMGRPKLFCGRTCTVRAQTRRRQAAGLLDDADLVEADVGKPGFGSEKYLRARAAGLRAMAAERLEGLPT
jgi:hypothetical protein